MLAIANREQHQITSNSEQPHKPKKTVQAVARTVSILWNDSRS